MFHILSVILFKENIFEVCDYGIIAQAIASLFVSVNFPLYI